MYSAQVKEALERKKETAFAGCILLTEKRYTGSLNGSTPSSPYTRITIPKRVLFAKEVFEGENRDRGWNEMRFHADYISSIS